LSAVISAFFHLSSVGVEASLLSKDFSISCGTRKKRAIETEKEGEYDIS